MGRISTGIGLISGMDFQSIISQLMVIEARPIRLLEARIAKANIRQAAYGELNARLLSAKSAISRLSRPSAFNVKVASTSNENVLTVSARNSAALGNYSFQVRSLVSTHQLVSSGFADSDFTTMGAGTLSFKVGAGRLDPATPFEALNGFEGVRRGIVRITDRSGTSADIDLRMVTNINEVLEAINTDLGINVYARVEGDQIKIVDQSGGSGVLSIQDVGGGFAAQDLGIAGLSATGEIAGTELIRLTNSIKLSVLNDGIGVRLDGTIDSDDTYTIDLKINLTGADDVNVKLEKYASFGTPLALMNDASGVRLGKIKITNQEGLFRIVDLSGLAADADLTDVQEAINNAVEDDLKVSFVSLIGGKINILDSSEGEESNLIIEDVDGGFAAADLGIVVDTEDTGFVGGEIYRMDTLGTVLKAIETAAGTTINDEQVLTATISNKGIVLTAAAGIQIDSVEESLAAKDLGLVGTFGPGPFESRDLIAGLNTVLLASLNGGSGIDTTGIQISLRQGGSPETINFTGQSSLQGIINAINDFEVGGLNVLKAQINAGGTGITITDLTSGSGTFAISENGGTTAADLSILSSALDNQIAGGDLHLQYIHEGSRLDELNLGKGVDYGTFQITDAGGNSAIIKLREGQHKTIGDVINEINNIGINSAVYVNIGVKASINETGDGIKLVAHGNGPLTVSEIGGGSAAEDLGILGTGTTISQGTGDVQVLSGSFTKTVEIGAHDSLEDVVQKINEADVGVRAAVINDGTQYNPYRLMITSELGGVAGNIVYDTGATDLSLSTLSEARDASVIVGDPGSPNAIFINSSSNTISDAIDGVTLNLVGTSDRPVKVSVTKDIESVVSDLSSFIDSFNETIARIDELSSFNAETEERGILLGDSTVQRVRSRLYRTLYATVHDPGLSLRGLTSIGVEVQKGGGGLIQLNEEKFRSVYAEKPEEVKKLLTLIKTDENDKAFPVGIAARLNKEIENLTTVAGGVLTLAKEGLQDQVESYNQRMSRLQDLLDNKEARYYAQFQAMEKALAGLQAQQSSLMALSNLASSFSSSRGILG